MPVRSAKALWKGTLREGQGTMSFGNFEGAYTRASRFESAEGTNPEELLGAAHAGCFSMFLSSTLTKAGYTPTSIATTAQVHLGDGPTITLIELDTVADVPGLDDAGLQAAAQESKEKCPVSKALAAVEIMMTARLAG
jgi:osmotically inducible protein OsmC